MKVKSKTPDDRKKGVIYQVPCKECTVHRRTLRVRLMEHRRAVQRGDTVLLYTSPIAADEYHCTARQYIGSESAYSSIVLLFPCKGNGT